MMEENGPDIVQMAIEGEETSSRLMRPDLDLVIVSSRHKERLSLVEVDSSYRAIMLLKTIDQSAHTIIPELNGGGVQRH